ncbi:uncharacterized protein LOC131286315 [Anopheles ziemanni]|uniref:uncharacterized protein LOC131259556 n=1 Tax=Anopheles coustani TaxID=139045 RepID=UPI0026586AC2|nr:uncharacterized protein LOC131259556 [Anopheles coustani]XP_058171235.1 uncharacterized protein LOC131286315 [Anopheles ziemanni]
MDRNSLSGTLVSSFCRICTTNNDVDWSIYETLKEDEATTNLHMMLVKLYPTVFNESQVLCDEALKWPMKICKECKAKVIESYSFYELCIKSARSLRTIALNEQSTTDTLQEEKDDHSAVIKTEFIECEETIVPKEEYDSEDHSSAYNGFNESSSRDDVFGDTEDSLPAQTSSSSSVHKMQQQKCIKNKANSRDLQRRKITSDTDRAKIIFAFEKGVTATEISKSMEINLSTIFGVISNYRKTGDIKAKKRGGTKSKMLSEAHISRIRALRKENSRLPLKKIQQKLLEEFGILVSSTTISRGLEKVVKKVIPAADVFSSEEFLKKFNS